jgi:pimeloyl-ACP methyl ester carboxylesterase
METVTSNDGTPIAYDRLGSGPPVALVCGGSVDRQANAGYAQLLAAHFTVFNFDRRGRGDSGDTPPYTIDREIEDIAAVIEAAGDSAGLWGSSSGGALALLATASGLPVSKLAVWEPPYFVDDRFTPPPADTASTYRRLVSEGRRGEAVEFFMGEVVGMPPEFVAWARTQPFWEGQERIAHTLAYDAEIMGDYSLPADRIAAIAVPTLVLTGGSSMPFMAPAAEAIVNLIPGARHVVLEGQDHNVAPEVLVPALRDFFGG